MIVKIIFALLSMSLVHAQVRSDTQPAALVSPTHQSITQQCLDCICEASSRCDLESRCENGVCGPFSISWSYWSNAGKLTLNHESPDKPSAYAHCVNDITCATKTVQGYMDGHAKDCNGDRLIDCNDYARIHHLGGYECDKSGDPEYMQTYQSCMQRINNVQFNNNRNTSI